MTRLAADSRARLATLAAQGLRRTPRAVRGSQGPRLLLDGREVLCFCSNDFLGLTAHPHLRKAGVDALHNEGSGAGASRLVSGNMNAHLEAEAALAAFVGAPAARLFSTGYAANLGALQALADRDSVIFSDRLNHASLIDGCRLSRARIVPYPHADPAALADLIEEHRPSHTRAFIVTDSVFSMDGDIAPLRELRALADRYDAYLYVDEAHALGVLGPHGRGACAAIDVRPDVLMGGLGKAFGVAGAFVASDADTIDWLYNRARSFVYSTGPAPILARQALASLEILRDADAERARLLAHAARLRRHLTARGQEVPAGDTPIVPIVLGSAERAVAVADALLERGIFVSAIRPPTVPEGTSRLRIVPTAAHDDDDLDRLLRALDEVLS